MPLMTSSALNTLLGVIVDSFHFDWTVGGRDFDSLDILSVEKPWESTWSVREKMVIWTSSNATIVLEPFRSFEKGVDFFYLVLF